MQSFRTIRQPFLGFYFRYQKSAVIFSEERVYIGGRVHLYSVKSAVIFPEERGYIAGRAWLYFAMKIVAYLSCSVGRTHFAKTNNLIGNTATG